MTNKSHRAVNSVAQNMLVLTLSIWLVLTLIVAVVTIATGQPLAVSILVGVLSAAPAICSLIVKRRGKDWPQSRQTLIAVLPWNLMGMLFIALSGGVSSPALVLAVYPPIVALLFGWRARAVETAVFSLLGAVGAALVATFFTGLPGAGALTIAVGYQALAGLVLLPLLAAALLGKSSPIEEPAKTSELASDIIVPATDSDVPVDPVMIVDVAHDGVIRSASGVPPGGIQPKTGQSFLASFPQDAQKDIAAGLETGGQFTQPALGDAGIAFTVDHHDLGTRVFLSPIDDSMLIHGATDIMVRDAESRAVQAEEALVQRTAFFAGLGHELKTPLNAILGFSDLMRAELRGPLADPYKEYTQLIHDSGQDLLLVVEDILDYAKAETGHSRLDLEPVDLVASGESVIAQLSGHASRAGVAIRQLAKGEVWAVADARAVRQIWQNLLSNAIKYSEPGKTVVIDARTGERSVALSVRDEGAGMDEADLDRVAKPFQQGKNAKGRAGTGLGLAVVKSFADQMKGKVIIDTAPGQGTRVRVVLPKASSDQLAGVEDAAE
ncbi:sensor histidine kinase [Henriciella litoralis]|uniref:sensor histidine kinase n=1 Tax=Henriciella litoralis TaxID=568102 RepID=UPI0009FD1374|nr:ATP-binding protein [Henriciella litoralis]